MKIIIHRDGEQYGPYTPDEIRQHLAQGNLMEVDLAFPEGGSEWRPLKEVLAKIGNDAPPPVVPAGADAPATKEDARINRFLIGGVMGAAALIVAAVLVLCLVPMGLENLLLPLFHGSPLSVHAVAGGNYLVVVSTGVGGDAIYSDVKTDYTMAKLRDELMDNIYSTATESPSAKKLMLTVHVTGGWSQKDVVLAPIDLEAVRQFMNKTAYAQSPERGVIDGELMAAGL
jgi:hypothetical protein